MELYLDGQYVGGYRPGETAYFQAYASDRLEVYRGGQRTRRSGVNVALQALPYENWRYQ